MTTNATEPILDDATKEFVRRVIHAELVSINEIKKVVVSLMADGVRGTLFSPERLAEGLVGADLLTRWQSRKLLSGKSRGFHLGNYRLLRPLGKGGMGVVFLAKHEVMSRQMALKILPAEASRDPRRIARFKEEARASAKLEHANIVQAFDFSESDGKLFIVMEYIEGHDLHRAVAKDGVMSAAESLDAMIQTTEALVHAHQRGIIHRDIKPSNLMLRSDGVIKVSDNGDARSRIELFNAAPGITVVDDLDRKQYPMPKDCVGKDDVFVGRIRADISGNGHGIAFWCVSDNLRKGAATNAVQIAELLQSSVASA